MTHKFLSLIGLLTVVLLVTACKPEAGMPNPASVYCEEQGGSLEIHTDQETGGQIGLCVFPDGSECEEWSFYRGECQPGDSLGGTADMPNPASVYCEGQGGSLEIHTDQETGGQVGLCVFPDGSQCEEWAFMRGECLVGGIYPVDTFAGDGCKLYTNPMLGYSFHFPADALIISAENPMKTITIQGPQKDDEHWPMIFFNHPDDRPEFLLSEGEDLAQWLEENNLPGGVRLENMLIAGQEAIHFRQDSGEQAFPADHFYFEHQGQIFNVVILHTGNQEDWTLYDHFLGSIQFNQ